MLYINIEALMHVEFCKISIKSVNVFVKMIVFIPLVNFYGKG
jgi:hypothetical protein